MKLTVKGENIIPYGSGMYSVELTDEMMRQVYEEQRRISVREDIAMELEGRIYECDMEEMYTKDWPHVFGDHLASSVIVSIDKNSDIQDQYSTLIVQHVENALRKNGINPDTMQRRRSE